MIPSTGAWGRARTPWLPCLPILLDFLGAFSNWNACSAGRSQADADKNSYIGTPKGPVAPNSFSCFHPLGPGGGLEHLGCPAYHYFWISLEPFPTGMLVLQADRRMTRTKMLYRHHQGAGGTEFLFMIPSTGACGRARTPWGTLPTTTSGFLWSLFQLECLFCRLIAGQCRPK